MRNQSLFEAYVQYCYSPKYAVGGQLLKVRRDKRERAAYAAAQDEEAYEDESMEVKDADSQTDYRLVKNF